MIPRALSIAGSDPGGGAGIQQDLKTLQAFGVWGMTAVTALTVQNTMGVRCFVEVDAQTVADQITAVVTDIGVDAAKTGMLASAGIVEAVARAVRDYEIEKLVVDPVLVSTHGDALHDPDVVDALVSSILPLASVVTPNVSEAGVIAGTDVRTVADQEGVARAILARGARAVFVTGGHLEGDESIDVLATPDGILHLTAPRIDTPNTHGTGCMLSAAICAGLAKGRGLETAVREAKAFVTGALRHALALGKGIGPVNPMWQATGDPIA